MEILIGCLFFYDNDPTNSYVKYYMPLVEIKDFSALINNKPVFDQPLKTKKSVWNTFRNVKKQWLWNRKLIRLFVPSKLL